MIDKLIIAGILAFFIALLMVMVMAMVMVIDDECMKENDKGEQKRL